MKKCEFFFDGNMTSEEATVSFCIKKVY